MKPCLCNPSTEALTAALRAVAIPRREIECNTRRQEAVSEYLQTPSKTQLLITDRVRFVTDNRKLIPAYQVSKHPGVWVSAVTLHIKSRNRFWQLLHQSLWDYSIRLKEDRSPKYPALTGH